LSFLLILTITYLSASVEAKLVAVQTLTRHGERAPDSIVAKQSCRTIFESKKDILHKFNAAPGRLTPLGVVRMREVGTYLRERYIEGIHWGDEQLKGFLHSDYQTHQDEWQFVAREGSRQQRSMSAIIQGVLPNTPVPIKVDPRTEDAVLGGPAPACGSRTARMIVDWHKSKGWEMLQESMDVVNAFEKICDVNLTGNPVNAKPGGPNPHAWIGDISDSIDSAFACGVPLPSEITPELHQDLTNLAFEVQEGSHYEDPKGAIMFAGGFPESLISLFEKYESIPEGKKRPKKTPKARLFSCSRELMYGMEKLFGWQTSLPNQPKGRVLSGTTFIWELHRVKDILDPSTSGLIVKSYYWQPELDEPVKLQKDVSLKTFRKQYEDYVAAYGGTWDEICDYKHFVPQHNHHDPDYVNPSTTVGHESEVVNSESSQPYVTNKISDESHSSVFSVVLILGLLVATFSTAPVLYRRFQGYETVQ